MSYGTQEYGTSIYSGLASDSVSTPKESDRFYSEAISTPLRFESNCDIVLATNENVVKDNLRNSVMVRLKGVPLQTHLGSLFSMMPFDPNDVPTRELLLEEIKRSIRVGEPRVAIDAAFRAVTSGAGRVIKLIVPFMIRKEREWRSLYIETPRIDQ